MMRSSVSNRTLTGEWHSQAIPERTSVRHGIGNAIELGRAEGAFDCQPFPGRRPNDGGAWANVLEWRLWFSERIVS